VDREIALARYVQRNELIDLWHSSFEADAGVEYFFNYRFQPENCLVYTIGGKVASMLHMLPLQIVTAEGPVPAHYIYAAATLPDYRGQGLMARLLSAAAHVGEWRGDSHSVLLPSEPSLYQYYGRHGYQDYFKARVVALTKDEVERQAQNTSPEVLMPDYPTLAARRNRFLNHQLGSALWPTTGLEYAAGFYGVYGGTLASVAQGKGISYALGLCLADEQCIIHEMIADIASLPALLAAVLRELPAKSYLLKLPAASDYWRDLGEVQRCGMIKCLKGATLPKDLAVFPMPYLGLTLD